jgi:hypothetical protein
MANEIQTAPNTTPTTNADWAAELNLRELSMKGYDGISLTEWAAGDEDKPQIAAGSVIEIDGAIAKFTTQTALTDEGGLADGWCYIKFVVSGSDVVPTLTNTFGTWDTAKQGFYDGTDRYSLFAMYRSGAITKIFTDKSIKSSAPTNVRNIPLDEDEEYGTYINKDSDYYANEKIKYKVFKGTGVNSQAYLTFTHNIANAQTARRVLFASMSYYLSNGTGAQIIVGDSQAGSSVSIDNVRITDTTITFNFMDDSNTTLSYTFVVAYV